MTELQRIRKERGFSQSELAKMANIKLKVLQSYDGDYKMTRSLDNAKLETLIKLANALNCQIYEILEDKNLKKLMQDYEESIVNE